LHQLFCGDGAPSLLHGNAWPTCFLSCVVRARLGMAVGIDGARLMKVAERKEWNGIGRLEEASGGNQRRTGKGGSEVCC